MTNDTTKLTKSSGQFTGSENWYRHGLIRNVLYTEGAKFVAEGGGAYWLLDEIALIQPPKSRRRGGIPGLELESTKTVAQP